MSNKWIVDVLTDLKAFAVKNDLPVLAAHLDDTVTVALAELAGQRPFERDVPGWEHGDKDRKISGTVGPVQNPG